MRVNTSRAEVVASIRFAENNLHRSKEGDVFENDVLNEVLEWKKRRRPALDRQEVAVHVRNLAALGWINVKPSEDLPLPEEEF